MRLRVQRGNEKLGEYTLEEIKNRLGKGDLHRDDLAWHETWDDWKPLGEVAELQDPLKEPNEPVAGADPKSEFPPEVLSEATEPITAQVPPATWEAGQAQTATDNAQDLERSDESTQVTSVDPDLENTTKLLRRALFSNPKGAIKVFFKDVKEYYRTILKQVRHPAFSIKEGRGDYFDDIELVKKSVSLYVTFILIGLALTEFSGAATEGNMAVAFLNLIGLFVFFATIWAAVWVGRLWMKWAKPDFSKRQIDRMFVYESCLVFAMVLPLLVTTSGLVLFVCATLAMVHPFYMFFRINKVAKTNILIRFYVGGILSFGYALSFLFQWAIGAVTSGVGV